MKILAHLFCLAVLTQALWAADLEPVRHRREVSKMAADLLVNYDKNEPPVRQPNGEDKPVGVKIGFHIIRLELDVKKGTMGALVYFRQSWNDPRLKASKKIRFPEELLDKVWFPDTFFRNSRNRNTNIGSHTQLLIVSDDGNMWSVQKFGEEFVCAFNLGGFPFDTQDCYIYIESFGQKADVLYLEPLHHAVEIDPGIPLPFYGVSSTKLHDCSQNYTTGTYPCLEVQITFQRDAGHVLKSIYFPSMLAVALSWAQFWFGGKHVTLRVILGLVPVLGLPVLGQRVTEYIPKVSYMTAVDMWLMFCAMLVVASFVETLVVSILGKKSGGSEKQPEAGSDSKHSKVDKICRILFPALFVLLNVIYWPVYASYTHHDDRHDDN